MIQTARLRLREYRADDYAVLRTIHGDPAVQALRGGYPLSEQETADEITYVMAAQQAQPRLRFQWMIETVLEDLAIGYCRLQITNAESGIAEIGYFLRRDKWGHGYGTEVARGMIAFGFTTLGLQRIIAGCIATNTPSVRVMEKTGMSIEGRLRADRRFNGEWHDTLLYAILKEEWEGSYTTK